MRRDFTKFVCLSQVCLTHGSHLAALHRPPARIQGSSKFAGLAAYGGANLAFGYLWQEPQEDI